MTKTGSPLRKRKLHLMIRCLTLPGSAHLAREVGPSLTTDLPSRPDAQRPRLSVVSAQNVYALLDNAASPSMIEEHDHVIGPLFFYDNNVPGYPIHQVLSQYARSLALMKVVF
ncbi:hypothetical protein EV715DRAFT_297928 [Schizophyllum commune]